MIKTKEYELKHIFHATAVLPLQMAVKNQGIRLKVIYGGLVLTVHIVTMQENLNSLMRDFLIIEKVFLYKWRLKINFTLMG